MNLLAHAFLSNNDNQHLIGNIIADHIKRVDIINLPNNIIDGINHHHKIDQYTDSHKIHKQSRKRLPENQKKYSSVIIDIFYDHFLVRNWKDYSDTDLNKFINNVYWQLFLNFNILPLRTKQLFPFMVASNWLFSYGDFDELQKRFDGMARRSRFNSGMDTAVKSLKQNYKFLEQDFKEFFPELIENTK